MNSQSKVNKEMKMFGRRKHNELMLKKCLSFTYVAFCESEPMCKRESCCFRCVVAAPKNHGMSLPYKEHHLEIDTSDDEDDRFERIQWAQLEEAQF